jgi:Flp pilus assembly protein TadG
MTRHRQRGLAMVEFVIGAPVLLLMLFAITEIGRAFVQYSQLASAARDAARYLATKALGGSSGVISLSATDSSAAQNLAVYGNAAGSGAPLLPNLATSQVTIATDASNNVSVRIAYPYQSLLGGTIPKFVSSGSINTGGWTLTVYTSMRAL